jgi:hypothetical protein
MKKIFAINTGPYFEWHIKLVGGFFVLAGVAWISQNLIGGALIIVAGLATFFTHYHFIIDVEKKLYREGLTIFGLRVGGTNKYQNVEYLFVKPQTVSRNYHSRIQSATIKDTEYNGYVRFSQNEKVHLIAAKTKQDVVDKLGPLSNFLKVQIVDYTREVTDVI